MKTRGWCSQLSWRPMSDILGTCVRGSLTWQHHFFLTCWAELGNYLLEDDNFVGADTQRAVQNLSCTKCPVPSWPRYFAVTLWVRWVVTPLFVQPESVIIPMQRGSLAGQSDSQGLCSSSRGCIWQHCQLIVFLCLFHEVLWNNLSTGPNTNFYVHAWFLGARIFFHNK